MDKKVQWRKMLLTVRLVYCGILGEGAQKFLMVEVVEIDYVYGSKCESTCLFSYRHLG